MKLENINIELEKAQNKDNSIKIQSTIGKSVNFLDVIVTNQDGQLRALIFHKPTAEPYILPYKFDHPSHIRRNIPYAAFLRVARIYSHVDNFNSERIRIDISLLLNDYPPTFISKQFKRFFHLNDTLSILTTLNEHIYHQLHKQLLYQPTRREKQLELMMEDTIRQQTALKPKIWDRQLLFINYTFDSALTLHLPNQFYKWWKQYYALSGSPVQNVKVRIVPTTNRTFENFFIQKKPSKDMLIKLETN